MKTSSDGAQDPWSTYRQISPADAQEPDPPSDAAANLSISNSIVGGRDSWTGRENPRLDDDEGEDVKFWWRGETERLCFDLPMTEENELTDGAHELHQWWDVSKVAESEHFIALCKPAGMFVVTDERGLWEESHTNFIHVTHRRFELPTRYEPRQRGICHRLDSHTSGIQVVGKSWEAFRHFMTMNMKHRMQKEYIALVDGKMGPSGDPCPDDPGFGLVDVPLKKYQDVGRREFGSVVCANEGLPTVTKYKVLRQFRVPARGLLKFWGKDRWFSLVQLRILTGRTHQIRVHMAFTGHPLVGDVKYNPNMLEQDTAIVPRIFLHCLRMEFEDMDGTVFVAVSDLAPDLQASLNRIQRLADADLNGDSILPVEGKMKEWVTNMRTEAAKPTSVGANAHMGAEDRWCAGGGVAEVGGSSDGLGFGGFKAILERSKRHSVAALLPSECTVEAVNDKSTPRDGGPKFDQPKRQTPPTYPLTCRLCGCTEVARRSLVRRSNRTAMVWSLDTQAEQSNAAEVESSPQELQYAPNSSERWGPNRLWVPTELRVREGDADRVRVANGESLDSAAWVRELGEWAAGGLDFAWAHDGDFVNGWMRLYSGGLLGTKWGSGSWKLLLVSSPPLLLATFREVEHALRLRRKDEGTSALPGAEPHCQKAIPCRTFYFEVVSVRKLFEGELTIAADEPADLLALTATCPTRGWPDPEVVSRRPWTRRDKDKD